MVCVHLGVPVLEACGAKYLVANRTARLQRTQRATRPATILLYQHDNNASVVKAITALQGKLNGVGHKVTIVSSEGALREEASSNQFNVVMMQVDAARRLRSDITSLAPHTTILPMQDFATRVEAARVKEEFGQVLALPTLDNQLYSVVQGAYQ
jgi:hypothetical protein